jgi:hypothetical protein
MTFYLQILLPVGVFIVFVILAMDTAFVVAADVFQDYRQNGRSQRLQRDQGD